MELENHYTNRSGWLRAAVLGANDGILSTTSIAIGVAAASITRQPITLAAIAGLAAGAMSMAAGEYVSVSSQSDIETADLAREKTELKGTCKSLPKKGTKEKVGNGSSRSTDQT
jgi:VIT1/CCC1 family predicted Fe2+/Mn2+ transporter